MIGVLKEEAQKDLVTTLFNQVEVLRHIKGGEEVNQYMEQAEKFCTQLRQSNSKHAQYAQRLYEYQLSKMK